MSEYIPDAQDLRDFEEFAEERDKACKYDTIKYGTTTYTFKLFPWSAGGETKYLTRLSIIEFIKSFACLMVDSDCTKSDIINHLLLFYKDKATLLQELKPVLNEHLTESEFQYLLNDTQPPRPYLEQYWNAIFGKNTLECYKETATQLRKDRILPYSVFNIERRDVELDYIQCELIRCTPTYSRPLYHLRSLCLGECDDHPVEYSLSTFLTKVLLHDKTLTSQLRWQFGVISTLAVTKNILKVTVPTDITIEKLQSYFNLIFTDVSDIRMNRNTERIHVTYIPNWSVPDENAIKCVPKTKRKKSEPKESKSVVITKVTCTENDTDKFYEYLNRIKDVVKSTKTPLFKVLRTFGVTKINDYNIIRKLIIGERTKSHKYTIVRLNRLFDESCGSKK